MNYEIEGDKGKNTPHLMIFEKYIILNHEQMRVSERGRDQHFSISPIFVIFSMPWIIE